MDAQFVIVKEMADGRRRYFRGLTQDGVVWQTTYVVALAQAFPTADAATRTIREANKQYEGWSVARRAPLP